MKCEPVMFKRKGLWQVGWTLYDGPPRTDGRKAVAWVENGKVYGKTVDQAIPLADVTVEMLHKLA